MSTSKRRSTSNHVRRSSLITNNYTEWNRLHKTTIIIKKKTVGIPERSKIKSDIQACLEMYYKEINYLEILSHFFLHERHIDEGYTIEVTFFGLAAAKNS